MYNLAIGDKTYSSWSLRGWLLFASFDIPVTIETARMYSPEFLEMLKGYGGGRLVPAIRFGDTAVTDTLAIAETLNERHLDKQMWPADVEARGFARSIVAEMHSGFSNLRNDCTMNLRHCYAGFTPSEAVKFDVARADRIITTAREKWGSAGPWLFGEYSIADAFYAPLATRILTYDLQVSDVAQAYVQTTINDPKFKQWRAEGLAENYVQPGYDMELPVVAWPNT